MQFSVGDKVVHPRHGPGQIVGVERKELLNGARVYYVIEIPVQDLTVFIPLQKMDESGVRPAMSRRKLPRVLDTLRSSPDRLPKDYKERQEEVWEKIKSGRPILIAEAVRDLTWRRQRAHLTRKDSDYLDKGRQFLAAEMALVFDTELPDAEKRIEAALADAMANAAN